MTIIAESRRFPIQDGPSVPWWVMSPHEAQARINHSQTLDRLAERGGLASHEAYAIISGKNPRDFCQKEAAQLWRDFADRVNMPMLVCPNCAHESSAILGKLDGYNVFKCIRVGCHHSWRTPMLGHVRMRGIEAPSESAKYHGAAYHTDFFRARGIASFEERWEEHFAAGKARVQALRRYRQRGDLLDIGCGPGAFVTAALEAGFSAYGIDLGSSAIEFAKSRNPQHSWRFRVESLPIPGGMDIITAHDVLEHLVDPFDYLTKIARCLAVGGLLVIEQPDPACVEAIRDGINFRHIKPYEHTMLPPISAWTEMLSAVGLKVLANDVPIPTKMRIYAERVT